jgi:PqqD family protein of HPr-rel-A system
LRFAAVEGTLLAPVGSLWAAFSPLSGETTVLNDESAAILEVLAEGPRSMSDLCVSLAADTGQPADELAPVIGACWPRLIDAGLVRRLTDGTAGADATDC